MVIFRNKKIYLAWMRNTISIEYHVMLAVPLTKFQYCHYDSICRYPSVYSYTEATVIISDRKLSKNLLQIIRQTHCNLFISELTCIWHYPLKRVFRPFSLRWLQLLDSSIKFVCAQGLHPVAQSLFFQQPRGWDKGNLYSVTFALKLNDSVWLHFTAASILIRTANKQEWFWIYKYWTIPGSNTRAEHVSQWKMEGLRRTNEKKKINKQIHTKRHKW